MRKTSAEKTKKKQKKTYTSQMSTIDVPHR